MTSNSPQGCPMPVWLDCDTGHDDAFALLLAARHPVLTILGVSTTYGNAPLEHTTYNTRAILKAIRREDVAVFAGASKPFCRQAAHAPDIHGETGLGGTTCLPTPTVPSRNDTTAVDAIYRALMSQAPGTAWLVATGALTNAALLFSIYPDLASHIAGLSIMGGAIGNNFSQAPLAAIKGEGERFGNYTPYAEFNICIDPESAQAIFSNEILAKKTTLIPLDLTHQFLATPDIVDLMHYGTQHSKSSKPSSLRQLFHEILVFFAKTYADLFGLTDGPPTHDPLAVAAIFAPHLFNDQGGERFAVNVITDGEAGFYNQDSQCGRTVATLLPKGDHGIRIPRGLEKEKLWRILEDCLSRAEQ